MSDTFVNFNDASENNDDFVDFENSDDESHFQNNRVNKQASLDIQISSPLLDQNIMNYMEDYEENEEDDNKSNTTNDPKVYYEYVKKKYQNDLKKTTNVNIGMHKSNKQSMGAKLTEQGIKQTEMLKKLDEYKKKYPYLELENKNLSLSDNFETVKKVYNKARLDIIKGFDDEIIIDQKEPTHNISSSAFKPMYNINKLEDKFDGIKTIIKDIHMGYQISDDKKQEVKDFIKMYDQMKEFAEDDINKLKELVNNPNFDKISTGFCEKAVGYKALMDSYSTTTNVPLWRYICTGYPAQTTKNPFYDSCAIGKNVLEGNIDYPLKNVAIGGQSLSSSSVSISGFGENWASLNATHQISCSSEDDDIPDLVDNLYNESRKTSGEFNKSSNAVGPIGVVGPEGTKGLYGPTGLSDVCEHDGPMICQDCKNKKKEKENMKKYDHKKYSGYYDDLGPTGPTDGTNPSYFKIHKLIEKFENKIKNQD